MRIGWAWGLCGCVAFSAAGCGGDEDGASNDAAAARCGDGVLEQGERCDDGNDEPGDGCAVCEPEAGWGCAPDRACVEVCGDSLVVGGEACDRGLDAYCVDCRVSEGRCGDGVLQGAETCDAGEAEPAGCSECSHVFGYVCAGAPSVCAQSGLPSEALVAELGVDETLALCEWLVELFGGAGHLLSCEGGERRRLVNGPDCYDQLWYDEVDFTSASVGELEQGAIEAGDECALFAKYRIAFRER